MVTEQGFSRELGFEIADLDEQTLALLVVLYFQCGQPSFIPIPFVNTRLIAWTSKCYDLRGANVLIQILLCLRNLFLLPTELFIRQSQSCLRLFLRPL